MTERAYLAHRTPGRVRLRLPERRGDIGFFADLARRLADCEGVARVETNPRTGSVLIMHTGELEPILRWGERERRFALLGREPREPSMGERLRAEVAGFSQGLRRATSGQLDLPTAAFVLLLAGAAVQMRRGSLLSPATTLLWYASSLLAAQRTPAGRSDDAPIEEH